MAKRAISLGKGLDALLPSSFSIEPPDAAKPDDGQSVGVIAMIDVKRVRPNPMQPRQDFDREALEDLKKSIKEKGVIQPITVRRMDNGYEIIAGERRVRASTEVGLQTIPAYILDVETDADMLELALIENVQRENLNPVEVALGYKRLMEECHLTQEEVSKKVGKDRTTITNFLRLLRLPGTIQESLRKKTLSMGHARAILAVTDERKQISVFEQVRAQELSVRRTEEIVKKIEAGASIEEALAEKPAAQAPQAFHGAIDQPLSEISNRAGSGGFGGSKTPLPVVSTDGFAIPDDLKDDFAPAEADDLPERTKSSMEAPQKDATIVALETKFRHILATQVRIKTRPNTQSGSIEIDFYSNDELERLTELLEIIEREQYS
ncbi:MAG: ParB/RepB/Spo0J family partition protein [Candidatus Kapabacteria bacterium]|jgi:ParB family chromosome partitioning protein|nr:ParB/RepB/Spo0J family partition protein [Candidatus Kapabacteria bacterium]